MLYFRDMITFLHINKYLNDKQDIGMLVGNGKNTMGHLIFV